MKKALMPMLALLLAILSVPRAAACTIFTLVQGDEVFFGGNEDQKKNQSYLIVDTSGKYGAVYVATPWEQWPILMQTGINEKGLCFDSNWIPEEKLDPHPERKAADATILTTFMKECSSVEEVVSRLPAIDFGDKCSYQFHFADATGDAVVIHPDGKGGMTCTRKPEGDGYLISTNFSLEFLESGLWSCWRYKAADALLANAEKAKDVSAETARDVLAATHQALAFARTIYSELYDLKRLRVYLFYEADFSRPYAFDLADMLARHRGGMKKPLKECFPSSARRPK